MVIMGESAPGGQRGDAGYVSQGGKVVHSREASRFPRVLFLALLRLMALYLLDAVLEQPALEPVGRTHRRCLRTSH
jgi:hypothetical protein